MNVLQAAKHTSLCGSPATALARHMSSGSANDEVHQIKLGLSKVQSMIDACDGEIRAVEGEVRVAASQAVNPELSVDERAYWRKEKEQLRKKEEQLRKKEEQLRKEKELLLAHRRDGAEARAKDKESAAFIAAAKAWDPSIAVRVAGGDRVSWSRDPERDAYAEEQLAMHASCIELEEALSASAPRSLGTRLNNGKAEHLGAGVIVQRGVVAIDADSRLHSSTITRREQRHMAQLAIAAVSDPTSKRKVVVVGQPGIGKTRGGLTYTLQLLLARGDAVMRVSYKTNEVHLFLPQGEGRRYRAWQSSASQWSESMLLQARSLYVLIDPPEDAPYTDAAPCFVIKYASNNVKHYRNLHKDGTLLITATPTEEELMAMLPELWNEASPLPGQQLSTFEEQRAEVLKRAQLVGRAPRYIYSASRFREHLDSMVNDANRLARRMEGQPNQLLAFLFGECTNAEQHESSVSSRLFTLEPECRGLVDGWASRCRAEVKLKDVAALVMGDQLEKVIDAFSVKDAFVFERFAQEYLECGLDAHPPSPRDRWRPQSSSAVESSQAMVRLMNASEHDDDTGQVYFRTSNGFPVVDLVTSVRRGAPQDASGTIVQEWWNAKVGAAKPEVSSSAFMTLMHKLGLVDSSGLWIGPKSQIRFKLTMLCSVRTSTGVKFTDTHRKLVGKGIGNFEQAKALFDECMDVECVDAMAWKSQWRTWREGRMSCTQALVAEYTNLPGSSLSGRRVA